MEGCRCWQWMQPATGCVPKFSSGIALNRNNAKFLKKKNFSIFLKIDLIKLKLKKKKFILNAEWREESVGLPAVGSQTPTTVQEQRRGLQWHASLWRRHIHLQGVQSPMLRHSKGLFCCYLSMLLWFFFAECVGIEMTVMFLPILWAATPDQYVAGHGRVGGRVQQDVEEFFFFNFFLNEFDCFFLWTFKLIISFFFFLMSFFCELLNWLFHFFFLIFFFNFYIDSYAKNEWIRWDLRRRYRWIPMHRCSRASKDFSTSRTRPDLLRHHNRQPKVTPNRSTTKKWWN